LAATGLAGQADDLAGSDLEVDAVDRAGNPLAEPVFDLEPAELEHGRHGRGGDRHGLRCGLGGDHAPSARTTARPPKSAAAIRRVTRPCQRSVRSPALLSSSMSARINTTPRTVSA